MSFLDIRFPTNISKGSSGGPGFNTAVISFKSGHDVRNAAWEYPRGEYDVAYGVKERQGLYDLLQFFTVVMGKAYSFRYKDWMDFKSCRYDGIPAFTDCTIATADGVETSFQLYKVYKFTGINGSTLYTQSRVITKPVPGTVLIGVNGVNQTTGWAVDTSTGIITFSAPPTDTHVITAGFEFDVHCNFETDKLSIELESYFSGQASVPLKERKAA
jgi:uncharacterized protein (TIGR02217 family)